MVPSIMFQDSRVASEYISTLNRQHESPSIRFALGKNNWPEAILTLPSGAHAVICLYGAHLRSWIDKKGREILFLSENAIYSQGKTVRGGITVLLPSVPAKTDSDTAAESSSSAFWLFKSCTSDPAAPSITLSLEHPGSAQTTPAQSFTVDLTFTLSDALTIQVQIKSTSKQEIVTRLCLDNYLSTQSIHNVLVRGLEDVAFVDNYQGGIRRGASPSKALKFSGGINRVYDNAPQSMTVHGTGGYVLTIDSSLPDRVAWNPGKTAAAKLADLPPNGFEKFVCLSSGAIENPIRLAPGARWSAHQKISLER